MNVNWTVAGPILGAAISAGIGLAAVLLRLWANRDKDKADAASVHIESATKMAREWEHAYDRIAEHVAELEQKLKSVEDTTAECGMLRRRLNMSRQVMWRLSAAGEKLAHIVEMDYADCPEVREMASAITAARRILGERNP